MSHLLKLTLKGRITVNDSASIFIPVNLCEISHVNAHDAIADI